MNNYSKTTEKVEELMAQATHAASQAADKLLPMAKELAAQSKDLAAQTAEKASQAAEKIRPVAEEAVSRAAGVASEAKEKAVSEYLPKAKQLAQTAVDAATDTDGDLRTRASAVATSLKAETTKPKKRRCKKTLCTLAILGGAAAAAVAVWKRSQPVEDPWAEDYWNDVELPENADAIDESLTPEEPATEKVEAVEEVKELGVEALEDELEESSDSEHIAAEDSGESAKDGPSK